MLECFVWIEYYTGISVSVGLCTEGFCFLYWWIQLEARGSSGIQVEWSVLPGDLVGDEFYPGDQGRDEFYTGGSSWRWVLPWGIMWEMSSTQVDQVGDECPTGGSSWRWVLHWWIRLEMSFTLGDQVGDEFYMVEMSSTLEDQVGDEFYAGDQVWDECSLHSWGLRWWIEAGFSATLAGSAEAKGYIGGAGC